MEIYIDNKGNLFDGATCNTTGMTLCQMDTDGSLFASYNLDGTADTVKIEADALVMTRSIFRTERDEALAIADIEINKLFDLGLDYSA
jgi:hypothetical protein